MHRLNDIYRTVLTVLLAIAPVVLTVSCYEENHPGTYYTFTGKTLADYLEQDSAQRFNSFVAVLKRASKWGELDTYGTYTCFAPTDAALSAIWSQGTSVQSIHSLMRIVIPLPGLT
jgi:uncharacterized surface protein with fasciclin (FAS1) repeats